jgi:hypothetical protein
VRRLQRAQQPTPWLWKTWVWKRRD